MVSGIEQDTALKLPRMPELSDSEMSDEQHDAARELVSGPRKGLGGPFHPWLRSPGAARALGKLGEHLRYRTSLPRDLNELAILITARHWMSQFEWFAHEEQARAAGLEAGLIEAIRLGRRPTGMRARDEIVYDFCTRLRADGGIDDALYANSVELLGEDGVIDLVALLGLYDTVAMTLAVARWPLPEGVASPLR